MTTSVWQIAASSMSLSVLTATRPRRSSTRTKETRGYAPTRWAEVISEGPRDERLASLLGRSAIERPLPATTDRRGVPHSSGLLVLLRRWRLPFLRRPLHR